MEDVSAHMLTMLSVEQHFPSLVLFCSHPEHAGEGVQAEDADRPVRPRRDPLRLLLRQGQRRRERPAQ